MDDELTARLEAGGGEAIADPAEAWRRLHQHEGRRATLVDRYALEAAARGVAAADLSEDDRARLRAEVLVVRYPEIELLGDGREDPVEVVAYDPAWAARFAKWRRRLARALGPVADRIESIGSTAVPGLVAKPVVDIQVSVPDVDAEASYAPTIEGLGAPLRAREPDHRYFRPPPGRPRDVQIHACATGSSWEVDHLLFRDHLRARPHVREAYGRLELELARRFRHDRLAYNEAKTVFILDTLEAARAWAATTGWIVG